MSKFFRNKRAANFACPLFAALTLLLSSTAARAQGIIHLDFWGTLSAPVTYSLTATQSVTVIIGSTNVNVQPGTSSFTLPGGTKSFDITFTNPNAVEAFNFDYRWTSNGYNNKITGITFRGFDNLKEVSLNQNALTQPVNDMLPLSCTVNYGTQEDVAFDVLQGNIIDTAPYVTQQWDIEWIDATGTPLTGETVEQIDASRFHFKKSLDYYVKASLTHRSTSFRLQTGNLSCHRHLTPLVRFSSNGTGTATEIRVEAANAGMMPLIASCIDTEESDDFKVTLRSSQLKQAQQNVDLKVNFTNRINRLYMSEMGLTQIAFPDGCEQLTTVDLSENCLLPSSLPEALTRVNTLTLTTSKQFTLSPSGNGYTFDLGAEKNAGATIAWLNRGGQPLDTSFYEEVDGVYTFVKPAGGITVRLTDPRFNNYTIQSKPIDIDFDFQPLCAFSFTCAGTFPFFSLTATKDLQVKIDDRATEVAPGTTTDILLPASGNTTIYTTDNSVVTILAFTNLGITDFRFLDSCSSLESVDFSGNDFSPLQMPHNVPTNARVLWGTQTPTDLSPYRLSQSNALNLTPFNPWMFRWHHADTQQEITPDKYVERPAYCFEFENIGTVFATIANDQYPGLVFQSKPLEFNLKPSLLESLRSESHVSYSLNGNILSVFEPCTVFTPSGRHIATVNSRDETVLPPGIYILVFGSHTAKLYIH